MDIDTKENDQIGAVCELVRRFAHEILARQKQYRDDLLISCLQLIISLPSECIDYDFADYVPAIQVERRSIEFVPSRTSVQLALSLGLTYLPLAEQTIHSLERWSRSSSINLSNFYDQILPCLDDFLRLSHEQGNSTIVHGCDTHRWLSRRRCQRSSGGLVLAREDSAAFEEQTRPAHTHAEEKQTDQTRKTVLSASLCHTCSFDSSSKIATFAAFNSESSVIWAR